MKHIIIIILSVFVFTANAQENTFWDKFFTGAEKVISIYNTLSDPELMEEMENIKSEKGIGIYTRCYLDDTTVYATLLNLISDARYEVLQPPFLCIDLHFSPSGEQGYFVEVEFTLSPDLSNFQPMLIPLSAEINDILTQTFNPEENDNLVEALINFLRNLFGNPYPNVHTPFTVHFLPANDQVYGFDSLEYQCLSGEYKTVKINKTTYYLPWKSLEAGVADKVIMKISINNDTVFQHNYTFDSLNFALHPENMELFSQGDISEKFLNLQTNSKNDKSSVHATYNDYSNPENTIVPLVGKLALAVYEKETYSVILVSLNGAEIPAVNETNSSLNSIYSPAVVDFTVSSISDFSCTCDINNNGLFDNSDADDYLNYTAEMKAVIECLEARSDYNPEAYYLFFAENPTNTSMAGYMPFKKHFGFLFSQNQRDIAHELGHGIFNLRHTFSQYPALSQNSTQNLMDYGNGTKLFKYQWDNIHNPAWVVNWLEGEEEGMAFGEFDALCINDINAIQTLSKYHFYLADGRIVDFGSSLAAGFYTQNDITPQVRGSVYAVKIDENHYGNTYIRSKDSCTGFGYIYTSNPRTVLRKLEIDDLNILSASDNAVRVFINEEEKTISVRKNNEEIESISFTGNCNCNYPVSMPGLAEGLGIEFFNTHKTNPNIDAEILYEIASLINQVSPEIYAEYEHEALSEMTESDMVWYQMGGYSSLQEFETFRDALQAFINNKQFLLQKLENLDETSQVDLILKYADMITITHAREIPLNLRKKLLRVMAEFSFSEGPEIGGIMLWGNRAKYILFRLLETTPQSQVTGIIDFLKEGSRAEDLLSDVNNSNIDRLFGAYSMLANYKHLGRNYLNTSDLASISENLLFTKQEWGNPEDKVEVTHQINGSSINIKMTKCNSAYITEAPGYHSPAEYQCYEETELYNKNLDIFELISVEVLDDLSIISACPDGCIGEVLIVPAIFYQWLEQKEWNAFVADMQQLAFHLVVTGIGIFELPAAITLMDKLFALAEIGLPILNEIMNSGGMQELLISNFGEERAATITQALNIADLIFGVTAMGRGVIRPMNLDNSIEAVAHYKLIKEDPGISAHLQTQTKYNTLEKRMQILEHEIDKKGALSRLEDRIVEIRKGVGVLDGEIVRGVTRAKFMESSQGILPQDKLETAYQLWKNEEYLELYEFCLNFGSSDIKWPPCFGFTNIERKTLKQGDILDRYAFNGPDLDNHQRTGYYASTKQPNGESFSFDARALPGDEANYAEYYEIRVLEDFDVDFGKAMPWFGKPGMADQVKFDVDLADLAEQGKIEIINIIRIKQ
ncbi:MAG: TNT domain-containing protein [Bacteroidales bacterium]|nr:TNT domain-containing protein [Bacteroidales bacterium]